MKFQAMLEANGLTEKTASPAIKRRISEYNELTSQLNAAQNELDSGAAISEEVRQELQDTVDKNSSMLPELDQDICDNITKYVANKAMYEERGKKMKEGREKARGSQKTEDTPEEPASTEQALPQGDINTLPAETTEANTTPPAAEPKEEEKKGVGIGGVLLAAAAVIGVFFGIKAFNNR